MRSVLAGRIGFTLGGLVLYRLGTYVPLPGIDPVLWEQVFRSQSSGILGALDVLSGGAIQRLSIFSIGIFPYITTAVLVQLFTLVFGIRRRLDARGERGDRTIERVTLGLAALSVMFQSLGIAQGLEGYGSVVSEPGWLFRLSTVATLTGGMFFLVWLSRQITLRGVGNGLALLLFVGIAAEVPASIAVVLEFGQKGVAESNLVLEVLFATAAVVVSIVVMESARRRVPIEYSGRQVGGQTVVPRTSDLSLKLNNAGLIPVVVASWLLGVLRTLASLFGVPGSWLAAAAEQLRIGRVGFAIFFVVATVLGQGRVLPLECAARAARGVSSGRMLDSPPARGASANSKGASWTGPTSRRQRRPSAGQGTRWRVGWRIRHGRTLPGRVGSVG